MGIHIFVSSFGVIFVSVKVIKDFYEQNLGIKLYSRALNHLTHTLMLSQGCW